MTSIKRVLVTFLCSIAPIALLSIDGQRLVEDENGTSNKSASTVFDTDGDGLSDYIEVYRRGTDPDNAPSWNTDGDPSNRDDYDDAVGYDAKLNFDAAPEVVYSVVPLGPKSSYGQIYSLNNKGTVAFESLDTGEFNLKKLGSTPSSISGYFLDLNNRGDCMYYETGLHPKVYAVDSAGTLFKTIELDEFRDSFDYNLDVSFKQIGSGDKAFYNAVQRSSNILIENGTLDENRHAFFNVSAYYSYEEFSNYELVNGEWQLSQAVWWELFFYGLTYSEDQLLNDSVFTYAYFHQSSYSPEIVNPADHPLGEMTSHFTDEGIPEIEGFSLIKANHSGDFQIVSGQRAGYEGFSGDTNIEFSDGYSLQVSSGSENCPAFGRINEMDGLWKAWSEEQTMSLTEPEQGSTILSQFEGDPLDVTKITEKGLLLTEQGLWRNGRLLTEAEILGSESEWSNLNIDAISDDGSFVVGHALNEFGESYYLLLFQLEYIQSSGDSENSPLDYLAMFSPNNPSGKGLPTYGEILPTLSLTLEDLDDSEIDTISITFAGETQTMTETGVNNLSFKNNTDSILLTLSEPPILSPLDEEELVAQLTLTDIGIFDYSIKLYETEVSSNTFLSSNSIGIKLSELRIDHGSTDILTGSLYIDNIANPFSLIEDGAESNNYTSDEITIEILSSSIDNHILINLSDFNSGISNSLISLYTYDSITFSNIAESTNTNLSHEQIDVPEFAAWKVRIHANIEDIASAGIKLLTNASDEENRTIQVDFQKQMPNIYDSTATYVVIDEQSDSNFLDSSYTPVKVSTSSLYYGSNMDITATGPFVLLGSFENLFGNKIKVEPNAVVLQSLDFISKFGQGLDPEDRIAEPIENLGYTVLRDFNAGTEDTISDYIKGKKIWYSMSHGVTDDGTTKTDFIGLAFKDAETRADDLISSTKLTQLQLDYNLVIVDGCMSAQTSKVSEDDAILKNTLLTGSSDFAQSFGSNAAYLGWGWTMGPNAAQVWSSEFVNNLNGKKTVKEAHEKFLTDNAAAPAARLLKLFGNSNQIIDLN
ncbi:thrombospondin type 3 repeat-containing protein [Cerasicoccus frondis]|uniref:thrombospondin type 3 repeat-containing protein n=1 Tax=Cerasicoccus frondis TaxID=490090 RepID=UPI0028526E1B|nr:thrombospondin type 3 repeat-containing protein [Cerasicoccus frondis]